MATAAAPIELPQDLAWINTDAPPDLAGLRGRVVLLYFWTFDHSSSLNLLADVTYLEQKYHDGLAALGIHTPNFAYQRDSAPVGKAINRLGLRHAVANDPNFLLWRQLGVQAWPTVVLLDVDGQAAGVFAGEGHRHAIETRVAALLDDAARRDRRVFEPWPEALRPEPRGALAFPARLLATAQHLYISDTAHHRILETSHEGRVLRQFGSGNPGFADGRNAAVSFSAPQGVCLLKDSLYIADTGNHAIRRIRLGGGDVETVAGKGHLGRDRPQEHAEPASVGMSAPSDIVGLGDQLYFSVTGQNQVWTLDVVKKTLSVFAGSGRYARDDGDGAHASFAAPSGLAVLGQQLVVADAGASAIRLVRLLDGRVNTIVGSGPFEFGDTAGKADAVRLQRPMGVCVDPRGLVFIADTFNNRLKALNAKTAEVRAFNLAYKFDQPEGLSLAAGALWVANTNAHEIVRVDLTNGAVRRIPVGE